MTKGVNPLNLELVQTLYLRGWWFPYSKQFTQTFPPWFFRRWPLYVPINRFKEYIPVFWILGDSSA